MSEKKKAALLTFHSFDGGGPEYSVRIADEAVASYNMKRKYFDENHENQCGSGYEVIIEFCALRQGETTATVECRSTIADNFDAVYSIKVSENSEITVTEIEKNDFFR